MNIKLSVFSSRTKSRSGFAVYVNGDMVEYNVSKVTDSNIKVDVLNQLAKGLRACRSHISHEDILYIEIQNQHLCAWLNGNMEYKGYSEHLDSAFEVLESLDCRYKFMFVKEPVVKNFVLTSEIKLEGHSLEDAFSDLE